MTGDVRANLKERIADNERKIEDISAFRDDPKIDKIIRVLRKQIAKDMYALAMSDVHSSLRHLRKIDGRQSQ